MIDTVKLNLYDLKFKDSSFITIVKEIFNNTETKRELFINENGEIIQGSKGFLNNEFFNLSIKPQTQLFNDYQKKIATYKNYKGGYLDKGWDLVEYEELKRSNTFNVSIFDNTNTNFILQTSLSKLYAIKTGSNEKNLLYLNDNQIKESILFLEKKLTQFGLLADLDTAKLIRYDIFVNLKTKYNFETYSNFLKSFRITRKKLLDYDSKTLTWLNNQSEICIYDKQKELLDNNFTVDKKIMRIENRFLKKKKVFNELGNNRLDTLLDRQNHLNNLQKVYNQLFKEENNFYIKKDFETLLNSDLSLKQIQEKIFYTELINNYPKDYLLDISKDQLSKSNFYRFRKNLETVTRNKANNSKINLFDELKNKYAGELEILSKNT